jgi:hypothetical protein
MTSSRKTQTSCESSDASLGALQDLAAVAFGGGLSKPRGNAKSYPMVVNSQAWLSINGVCV